MHRIQKITLSSGLFIASLVASSMALAGEGICTAPAGKAPQGSLQPQRLSVADNTAAGLYEGPVWHNNTLYFSHFLFSEGFPSKVLAYDGQTLSVAIKDSGSNGLAIDGQGQLLAGAHKHKAVVQLDIGSGKATPVASEYQANVFNSPNDLTLARDGSLFFTDPDFQRAAAPGGQPVTGVYQVKNGEVTLIDDTIANPNGIALSPDQTTLYVAGGGEHGFVRAYDLSGDLPYSQRTFASDITVPDGMAVDCLGNIYVTEHTAQRMRVFSAAGEQIAEAQFDANVTNAAFGGVQGTTLYVTGMGALWEIELDVAGMPY
ncbi:SMP-30/gluconolactonase/LRE family protein [Gilvimarinus sp. 1_MG-2023]|uniref:SMP-30/gluconolactonase/LRE family protein n=1 Tax=Gilvimarinus sp. 1_MG-2023 TaxID=3062638 RepID=UPI0026E46321|nr:SMP-30/gluconolactonase/LRE family protein [Gilvimarinus sp. 1_MG-2023]MDO6745905.1 SMP-30/gluconolactonase/LRE family protein [Gilvimarinus sp. 1_MG-2023]